MSSVISDRGALVALCKTHGFEVEAVRVRRQVWGAQVWATGRYVWVEDQEDIDWLLVDMSTAPIQDRYVGAQAA